MSPDGSMKRVCRAIGALAVVLWGSAMFAASQRPAPAAGDPAARVDFETAVRPIVAKHCLECHSQDARKGGLSLATYPDMLDGGKDGPVIRPGNGAGSLMIQRLMGQVDERMPKDADPLSDQRDRDRTPVDRRGRARDACVTGGAAALGGAARADAAGRAAADLARLDIADRSPRCHVPARPPGCQTRSGPGRAVRAPRVSRRLGAAAVAGRADRVHGRPVARQARRARDAAARRRRQYAEHWISFWNDLLRNDDGVTYYSEQNGRKSITPWLLSALRTNLPYDRFVSGSAESALPGGPEGFLIGVNWRGETSAARRRGCRRRRTPRRSSSAST